VRSLALALLVLVGAGVPAYAGGEFMAVAGGPGAVWVTGSFGVASLDAGTGRVRRRYVLPALSR
jgi:hypothetical protein